MDVKINATWKEALKDQFEQPYFHRIVAYLKQEKCLNKVLVSHDAGWYDPGKPEGGEFRGYTTLFRRLIPALEQEGFAESDIIQLIQHNPANAFSIGVKKWKKKRRG